MWQAYWEGRGRDLLLLAAAQDVAGAERVGPIVEEYGTTFPVLLDRQSTLGARLSFRIVPSGFFVGPNGDVCYRHLEDFDIADPRVRWNLDRFLAGEELKPPTEREPMDSRALELFAEGVGLYQAGETERAVEKWREALKIDPDNFVIRSQIWATEQPERFYPAVDRAWQELQLEKEGYDKPLP